MKKIILAVLTASVIIWSGCGNVGEDPFPAPGLMTVDGKTVAVLFKNGGLYNFDYTAQYDGIQLMEFTPKKPDPDGGSTGGSFTSLGRDMGKERKWWCPKKTEDNGALYSEQGPNAMEFRHDEKNNHVETWAITLFDDLNLPANKFSTLTFWFMFKNKANPDEIGKPGPFPASITFSVETSNGTNMLLNRGTYPIPDDEKDQQWRKGTLILNRTGVGTNELIKKWSVSVPGDAGLIYIDEISIYRQD